MNATIISPKETDADLLATLVRESNKDVALLFGLNSHNAPKHPSFCKPEWIRSELKRGQHYFLFTEDGVTKGCVAYEQPDENTAYLNRLSVLPKYRCQGIGSQLVNYVLGYAKEKGVTAVSIGIIAGHARLKEWYLKLGFAPGATKKFEHLPFDVLYMHYKLEGFPA